MIISSGNKSNFVSAFFVRKVLIEFEDRKVLNAAQSVLQISGARFSRPASDSQWVSKRFLQDALAPVDEILVDLDRFLVGILWRCRSTLAFRSIKDRAHEDVQ